MSKIIDCVTFFNENFIFELRYQIIKEHVDFMVICESNMIIEEIKRNLISILKNIYKMKK